MIAYIDRFLDHDEANQKTESSDQHDGEDADCGLPGVFLGLDIQGNVDFSDAARGGRCAGDFGGLQVNRPLAVVFPASADDIANVIIRVVEEGRGITVAARGNGHSIHGQAQVPGGAVIDMSAMKKPVAAGKQVGEAEAARRVEVGGGELWEEVLERCLAVEGNLAPRSWTDYLGLTVGGTLSVGGVSGQTFRHGPQISNVAELEVVTGKGEIKICSPEKDRELFFGVLGGLGQFGIITKATIFMDPAPNMVRWMRLVYADFDHFATDQELLATLPLDETVDYLEGFVFTNNENLFNGRPTVALLPDQSFDIGRLPDSAGPVLYCLELCFYDNTQPNGLVKRVEDVIGRLRFLPGLEYTCEIGYVEFLTRVKRAEVDAKANGMWDVPHPWVNLFVSQKNIRDFDQRVFRQVLHEGIGGPVLVYPMLKSKWDLSSSVALPEDEVFYLVALLRFTKPFPDGPSVDSMLAQNKEILRICESNNYDFKVYIPHYESQEQWKQHFGDQWPRLVARKAEFDPMAILAPGQKIFSHPSLPSS